MDLTVMNFAVVAIGVALIALVVFIGYLDGTFTE